MLTTKKELASRITEALFSDNLLNEADAESFEGLSREVERLILVSLMDYVIISGTVIE